jgi:hypothetical protein
VERDRTSVNLPDPNTFRAMVVAVKEALGEELLASQREHVMAYVREQVLALFQEAGTPVSQALGSREVDDD